MQSALLLHCITRSGFLNFARNSWRWLHVVDGYTNCYTGNTFNATACPDGETCAANCALDGAEYQSTYGITTSGDALTLKFVTVSANAAAHQELSSLTLGLQGSNVGSRVYLMDSESEYSMFDLAGNEFTFDVSGFPYLGGYCGSLTVFLPGRRQQSSVRSQWCALLLRDGSRRRIGQFPR